MEITILIPAAGASSRMRGTDKLVEAVDGQPLLRRQAERALATGLPVLVTLPPADHPHHAGRRAALDGLAVTPLMVAEAAEGLSASLRAGVAAAKDSAGLLVLLADLPEIGTADLGALIAGFEEAPGTVFRASAEDGAPGHPVLLPRRLFDQLARLHGDAGARDLLKAEQAAGRLQLLPLPGRRATTDLDTPEDWAAWRARHGAG
ncbi:nucleotidyltransferase family protein [Acidimangrovimonas pyrenivorans]|uniref:NTP transferase domain-containing protein n=1 Tax=Acidimangrovimonas pyrenivorans TaxID=2030798 RepID=A0ABV7AF70_9RHOB